MHDRRAAHIEEGYRTSVAELIALARAPLISDPDNAPMTHAVQRRVGRFLSRVSLLG
jgi:hypothetical protein